MRVVIFSKHDFEAMTVVDVPHNIIKWQERQYGDSAFPLRLLPRLKPMPLLPPEFECNEACMTYHAIDIWMERLVRRRPNAPNLSFQEAVMQGRAREYESWFMKTWVGYADDDGLELKSVFLPGQEWDVQVREREAW